MAKETTEKTEKTEVKTEKKETTEPGILRRATKALFGEKSDRIATFATVGGIVAYGAKQIFNKAASRLTEKGITIAEKKLEEIVLGKDTAEAKKSGVDEKFWELGLSQRTTDKDVIRKFRSDLKAVNSDQSDALVLRVAQLITGFHRETRKTSYVKKEGDQIDQNQGKKQGKGQQDKIEEKIDIYDFIVVNSFLDSLVKITEFGDRVKFLESEGVFDLIPKKGELWKSVSEAGSRIADKVAAKAATISEATKEDLGKNSADWVQKTEDWKAKAKAYRDGAGTTNTPRNQQRIEITNRYTRIREDK